MVRLTVTSKTIAILGSHLAAGYGNCPHLAADISSRITVMIHNRAAADTGRILAALCSHSTAANSDVSAGLRTGIFPCLLIAAATADTSTIRTTGGSHSTAADGNAAVDIHIIATVDTATAADTGATTDSIHFRVCARNSNRLYASLSISIANTSTAAALTARLRSHIATDNSNIRGICTAAYTNAAITAQL